jgi:hypothetical protein
MHTFNPFDKEFEEITTDDLNVLKEKEVAEGWYVEYKREVPQKVEKIAKSISSFSNQYGGWLFYGIEENKEPRKIRIYETKIRNAVVSHLNPHPFYEMKVLKGPCQKIKLESSKGIILIYVPPGSNPPYIHSSGVIYRRVGDSSEPKEETDRFLLEQLWEKGKKNREYLKSKIMERFNQANEHDANFFLKLFLIRDLYGDKLDIPRSDISFEDFSQIMKKMKKSFIDIHFDNISSTIDGHIARALHENILSDQVLTFRYSSRITKITTSVSYFKISEDNHQLIDFPWDYDCSEHFIEVMKKAKLKNATIVDLNTLFWLLMIVMSKYKAIMDVERCKDDIYAKILLENTYNIIPYIDSEAYIKFIEENMVPFTQENSIVLPPGFNYKNYIKIDKFNYIDFKKPPTCSEEHESCTYAPQMFLLMLFKSLGIPFDVANDSLIELLEKTLLKGLKGNKIYNMNWIVDK